MLVAAGLLVAFVLVVLLGRPGMRQCRWREDRSAGVDGTLWRCAACGASTPGARGRPPRRCLKGDTA